MPIVGLRGYDAGTKPCNVRVKFIVLWSALQLAKILLAIALPVFVDEAFYAWEARFPAWAYSDLPGLTAFLAGIGTGLGGDNPLALRAPFLLLGAAVPWLVVRIAARWFGEENGWWSGILCLLMPLGGLLGVLALPDVPLVFAALLCLDAIARLRQRSTVFGALELAGALAIGAMSHYRFALVIAAGLAGTLMDSRARRLLLDRKVWLALLAGALAWLPLLLWNLGNDSAGLKFQLFERNPWSFHVDALAWIPIQLLLVTPGLFGLLLVVLRESWSRRADDDAPWGLLAGVGAISVAGYFLLGFFADQQRVSFHWPLAGWLALTVAAPTILRSRGRAARLLIVGGAGVGLALALVFLVAAASPRGRHALAGSTLYPADFAGWQELAQHVRQRYPSPAQTLVASDFELAGQLAFALGRRDILVLDHPLNRKHGRATQIAAWGLRFDRTRLSGLLPLILVVDDTATPLKDRLSHYRRLCATFGGLPRPEILSVDRGRKRYLSYRIESIGNSERCVAPALAWIDSPAPGKSAMGEFAVSGWAIKEGVGVAQVVITIDGRPVASASYGRPMPGVAGYWKVSTDPNLPRVGFDARVDTAALAPGIHWLGLELRGADGSVEAWPAQKLYVTPK